VLSPNWKERFRAFKRRSSQIQEPAIEDNLERYQNHGAEFQARGPGMLADGRWLVSDEETSVRVRLDVGQRFSRFRWSMYAGTTGKGALLIGDFHDVL
jgi:hypothetical protein